MIENVCLPIHPRSDIAIFIQPDGMQIGISFSWLAALLRSVLIGYGLTNQSRNRATLVRLFFLRRGLPENFCSAPFFKRGSSDFAPVRLGGVALASLLWRLSHVPMILPEI